MGDDYTGPEAPIEHIDADAVCAQCGTVNPEDTLLCKSCGNNLRDQRLLRVAEGRGFDEAPEAPQLSRRVLGGLTIVGLLIVVWIGAKAREGALEDWLVDRLMGSAATARTYWGGSNSAVYDELLRQLELNPITPTERDRAMQSPASAQGFDGRYFIRLGNEPDDRVIGQANVRQEGSTLYFVAKLARRVEIRGAAQLREDGRPIVESAAVRIGDELTTAYGFAQKNDDGSFMCYGQSEIAENRTHSAVAYRVP